MKDILVLKSFVGFSNRWHIGRLYYDETGKPCVKITVLLPDGFGSSICSARFQEMVFDQVYALISMTIEKDEYFYALTKGKVVEFNSYDEAEKEALN